MVKGAVHVGTGRLLLNFHLEYECANLRVSAIVPKSSLRHCGEIFQLRETQPFLYSLLSLSSFQMRRTLTAKGLYTFMGYLLFA